VEEADRVRRSLLGRLAAHEGTGRCATVLGARSDAPKAPLPALPSAVERIPLDPLADGDVRAIVRSTLGGRRLPSRLLAPIVERSAGNPFFAVELARQLGSTAAAGSLAPGRIPEAIVALLAGRLE